MKSFLLAALIIAVTALGFYTLTAIFGRGELGNADDLILCDPATGNAYRIQPETGWFSSVWPVPNAKSLCTVNNSKE